MLNPPINELIELAGSRYALVIAVSKRARHIIEGEKILTDFKSVKPVTLATYELYSNKIEVKQSNTEE